ncbi:cobalamin adenosyltransferase [Pigmentiphaga sp. NML080357]|uniref:GlcG/HbpS family heme-binding protein n=1 Tax=Pigmentiphaga sp. NML080357 TaxID=2008675 RepID=UPI000B411FD2|nr:heme-binding protein [Pigmentiphaga sp. NML080357]OVZ55295.1 cobalamin adenosyltransferase [Pigmentiphaga sp. NML080357]
MENWTRITRALTLDAVRTALDAAVREASGQGIRVNVAVVDASGVLLGFLRMPGAFLHSADIAVDKAYTAAGFRLPTGAWDEALKGHSPAVRQGLPARPRFAGFGGGFPLVAEGELVGGIGVSGGSEEQDEACARAACAALGMGPG